MLSDERIMSIWHENALSEYPREYQMKAIRSVAEAAVKGAMGVAEPVAILICGEIGPNGEQDEFEIDCEYGALERFTSQHPGKKFKLYTHPQPSATVPELPFFAKTVIQKLQRFAEQSEDSGAGGTDIGRHWLDILTRFDLLNRTQRSPAIWEISQQGDDLLAASQPEVKS